jgi:hypothetical protein
MGRLLTFVARLDADSVDTVPNGAARGIGVNEDTAFEIEENGAARVVGNPYVKNLDVSQQLRSVYLVDTNGQRTPSQLSSPLNSQLSPPSKSFDFRVARLDYDPITGNSDTINLLNWGNWSGLHTYSISVINGALVSSPESTQVAQASRQHAPTNSSPYDSIIITFPVNATKRPLAGKSTVLAPYGSPVLELT